jgi:hypothetical protein
MPTRSRRSPLTRRRFLTTTAAAGTAAFAAPALLRGRNLNEKLNIAIIGCGGRGASNLADVSSENMGSSENIIALVDVNAENLARAAVKHPGLSNSPPVRHCGRVRRRGRQHLRTYARSTTCNFEYAGWLTEANHLGNVAYRAGRKLEWDAEQMRATNCPDAERFIKREYRKGWELG